MDNLERKMVDGVEKVSFVETTHAGRKPIAWHGLGTQFDKDRSLTLKEALDESGANYKVEMKDLFAATNPIANEMANGSIAMDTMLDGLVKTHKAIVRADNNDILGIVGPRYTPVQNEDAFKFVDFLCSGKDMNREDTPVIETAGVLGRGERIFVTAQFPEKYALSLDGDRRKDLINMYVAFTTSHDGKGAVCAMLTPTRIVCNNTLSLALRTAKNKLYFRHTSSVLDRMDLMKGENLKDATQVLGLYDIYKAELEKRFNELKEIKLLDKQMEHIMAQVLFNEEQYKIYQETNNVYSDGISKQAQSLFTSVMDNVHSGVGQDVDYKGTGMWLLNGITTYNQNAKDYKRGGDLRKFDGLMDGEENKQMQFAHDLILRCA